MVNLNWTKFHECLAFPPGQFHNQQSKYITVKTAWQNWLFHSLHPPHVVIYLDCLMVLFLSLNPLRIYWSRQLMVFWRLMSLLFSMYLHVTYVWCHSGLQQSARPHHRFRRREVIRLEDRKIERWSQWCYFLQFSPSITITTHGTRTQTRIHFPQINTYWCVIYFDRSL